MIEVTPTIVLNEGDLEFEFIRASGPGGQNVNKVATAVQLRFDAAHSSCLPEEIRQRLKRLAGRRMTSSGVVIIQARRFRTQEKNRQDAVERLVSLLRKASQPPKARRKTRPSLASKRRRLEQKRQKGQRKRGRKRPGPDE